MDSTLVLARQATSQRDVRIRAGLRHIPGLTALAVDNADARWLTVDQGQVGDGQRAQLGRAQAGHDRQADQHRVADVQPVAERPGDDGLAVEEIEEPGRFVRHQVLAAIQRRHRSSGLSYSA